MANERRGACFDDAGLPRTAALLKRHPKLKFIGCYEGIWSEFKKALPELMRSCDNLCIDTAGKFAAEELAYHVKTVSGADIATVNAAAEDSLPIIIATELLPSARRLSEIKTGMLIRRYSLTSPPHFIKISLSR